MWTRLGTMTVSFNYFIIVSYIQKEKKSGGVHKMAKAPYLTCPAKLCQLVFLQSGRQDTLIKENGACSNLLRGHHNLGRSRKLRSPGLFIPSSSFLWCLKNSSLYSGNNHFSFSPLCVRATCAQIALRRTYQLPNGTGFALGLHILLLLQLWSRRIKRKNKMRLLES